MARQTVQAKRSEDDEDDRDDENEEEARSIKLAYEDDEDEDEGDDIDAALVNSGNRKPSIYIDTWRKNRSIVVWLKPDAKATRVGRHKWFRIVQFTKRNGDEVSFIRFETFNGHEPADFASGSKERGDDLKRLHRARLCPMSKMIEWVDDAVIDGRISPDQVVFRFDDGNPEHLIELHAAGLTGLIGLQNAPEKWKKICKGSNVLQRDPWNENMNLKVNHVFQVVQDNNPSEVKWAVEPPDLWFQMKDAIVKEKKRTGDDKGDPVKTPYALLWEFDPAQAKKNWGKGNTVIPQPHKKLTPKIRRLLEGPKRKDQQDVIGPGNCLELRAAMENAAVIDMPFDEFFKEAKKAGLMTESPKSQLVKPSTEAKDNGDDEPKSDPKPKTAPKAAPVSAKAKPAPEPQVVGTCDICHQVIGDDDLECKSCGTVFDEDNEYHVSGIRCTECRTSVPLADAWDEDGDLKQICPKCGMIHRLSPSVERFYGALRSKVLKGEVKFVWTAEPQAPKKVEPKREGRSGRRNVSKIDTANKDEPYPF